MTLLATPLLEEHKKLGARLVEFAGYEMPVLYTSILDEHKAVRERVGLFDVSHMSNLWVEGPQAAALLSRTFVCDASQIPPGGSKYTAMLRDDANIIDDLYVFNVHGRLHVVPNAAMNTITVERLREIGTRADLPADAKITDATRDTCILALQGPRAAATLEKISGKSFAELPRFHTREMPEWGAHAFVSRTGYTGEDGFELFVPNDRAPGLWRELLAAGAAPCGLGARDTLRLEKGYCLAGHEFAGGHTPLQAALGWIVNWDHEFAGRDALAAERASGPRVRLVGVKLTDKGIPRQGSKLLAGEREIGAVTSGTLSPTLGIGIALGYVEAALAKAGTKIAVDIRGKLAAAEIVKPPFV
ncbi:MAG: glycine cleavage system aminomethyltransferase GcvT [Thermoplasmatota archaeon]